MRAFITVARRLIPATRIAYAEPFDPDANPDFDPKRDFRARVVLIGRDSLLTEDTLAAFAEAMAALARGPAPLCLTPMSRKSCA